MGEKGMDGVRCYLLREGAVRHGVAISWEAWRFYDTQEFR
jgi:hypothetical protein